MKDAFDLHDQLLETFSRMKTRVSPRPVTEALAFRLLSKIRVRAKRGLIRVLGRTGKVGAGAKDGPAEAGKVPRGELGLQDRSVGQMDVRPGPWQEKNGERLTQKQACSLSLSSYQTLRICGRAQSG